MDENKGTTAVRLAVTQDEESPADVAQAAGTALAEVGSGVDGATNSNPPRNGPATPVAHGTDDVQGVLDSVLAQTTELSEEVAGLIRDVTDENELGVVGLQAPATQSATARVEGVPVAGNPIVTAEQKPAPTEEAIAHETPKAAASTTSAPEAASVQQDEASASGGKDGEKESFDEFENAGDLIRQAQEEEQESARAAMEKSKESEAESVTDLDASLARDADRALGTEDSGEPSADAPAAVSTAKDEPREKHESQEIPAGASAASGAARPPKGDGTRAKKTTAGGVGGKASPPSQARETTQARRAAGVARTIRGVAKPLSRAGMKVLAPLATRYERVGAEKRKVVKMVAIGTMVQAAALWGYLMFGRTTDAAAIEAAANAKVGAVHPIAASLPEAGPAEGEGHGASEAPSSVHEPTAAHESAEKHGEGTGHGH